MSRLRRENIALVSSLDMPRDTQDIIDKVLRIMQSLSAASVNANTAEALSNITRSLSIVEAIVAPYIQTMHTAVNQQQEAVAATEEGHYRVNF